MPVYSPKPIQYKTRRDAGASQSPESMARRRLLGAGAGLAAGVLLGPAWAAAATAGERRLKFLNLHTGERLAAVYHADGARIETECRAIDRVLRDFRTGEVARIDRDLLDMLYLLQQKVDTPGEFHVISGYRSPKTNEKLRAAGRGVVKGSLHTQARAIDIRLPGCALADLRKAALALERGGVGYYPRSDFIHIDTGRVRFW